MAHFVPQLCETSETLTSDLSSQNGMAS